MAQHQHQNPQLHEDYIDLSEGVGSRLFDKPVNNMGVAYIYGEFDDFFFL